MTRVLGIDFGTKRLGLAFGDPLTGVAVPIDTVELHGNDPVKVVWGMIERDGYDHVVVGAPSDPTSKLHQAVVAFAKQLRNVSGITVTLVDEHLTTNIADQLAREHGGASHDDSLAAMLIVEEFLHEIASRFTKASRDKSQRSQ
ncbi:hypothetical protein A3C17_02925 [Candidatus Uhrbacteria bacterium RIFCSPHIGHO2_02_FULL_53_13]|uniref:Putative pre-16S rRNA nuclease n=3 Tax=Candidatus Uhriibacteriota TaxID=1752732 RepID=A0A1F7U0J6_9BACT|nr:MAG: hypothetical protein A3C17_02925 [Candidatus Uhrbacteria bacterium RIFCSPHIGHO2_02_FULL_53_13]OGL89085.1 MAG: hypothetical protein A3I45_02300 [Candidatus Uhrbacteria bacterium RIFCSPLOWO2_02_FULL_53_10]